MTNQKQNVQKESSLYHSITTAKNSMRIFVWRWGRLSRRTFAYWQNYKTCQFVLEHQQLFDWRNLKWKMTSRYFNLILQIDGDSYVQWTGLKVISSKTTDHIVFFMKSEWVYTKLKISKWSILIEWCESLWMYRRFYSHLVEAFMSVIRDTIRKIDRINK